MILEGFLYKSKGKKYAKLNNNLGDYILEHTKTSKMDCFDRLKAGLAMTSWENPSLRA